MNYVEISVSVEREDDRFHRRTLEARLATNDVPPLEVADTYLLGDMVVALRKLADEIETRLPVEHVEGEARILISPPWPPGSSPI